MKKSDLIFISIFLLIISIFIIPFTREGFESLTESFPYLMGFLKTSILASMGEMLANRISSGKYLSRKGILPRFFIWGILGMGFVLMFKVFASGVTEAMNSNLLPNVSGTGFISNLYRAFLISLILNIIFAPTFMILHRITDTFIDLKIKKKAKISVNEIIDNIEWKPFFGFVIFKTIPLFWIPAHTITFMLPENYRVLMAGFLSIALGLILTLSKIKSKKGESNEILS
ncbi:hypothetical protein RJI07_08270 [Mycoplasmatota bacterium WC30]